MISLNISAKTLCSITKRISKLKLKQASKLYVIIFYLVKRSLKNKSLSLLFYHWLFLIGLLILNSTFKSFLNILDRNKTDLHRFKPNSCNVLNQRTVEPLKSSSISGYVKVDIEVAN